MRKAVLNAAWNVSGQIVSLAVGLVALPALLNLLGATRLGIFTLALGLIGFSGLFDLGLGRALTQSVSSAVGQHRPRGVIAALVWRVVSMLAGFGTIWACLLWYASPLIVYRLFSLSGEMAGETILGVHILALSIPFALAATGAMGTLEGLQQFRLLNLWRMPMSLLQLGLPVLVAVVNPNVGWVIASLAFTRLLWFVLWLGYLWRFLPYEARAKVSPHDLNHALRFGGWLSVSNLIGPLMVYADRYYLASQFAPALVASYTVPFDTAYRGTALPVTIMNGLFPAIAEAQASTKTVSSLFKTAMRVMMVLILPPAVIISVLAHPLLQLWLGMAFATSSTLILKVLMLGVFLNSGGHLPYALLQAHGRSDLTAKLHVVELPLFALMLVWGVHALGITGAAAAWTARVGFDAIFLYLTAMFSHKSYRGDLLKALAWFVGGGTGLLLIICSHDPIVWYSVVGVAFASCAALTMEIILNWRTDIQSARARE